MAKSSVKVNVWNRALGKIGHTQLVESETERTTEREQCSLIYDDSLSEILAARAWPWAIRERTLDEVTTQDISYSSTTTPAPDGAITDYPVPFPFVEASQVTVEIDDVEQTETTHYTVTAAAAGNQADVVFVTPPEAGEVVKITVAVSRSGWSYTYSLPFDCVKVVGLLYTDLSFDRLTQDGRARYTVMVNDNNDGFILCTNIAQADMAGVSYVALVDNPAIYPRSFVDAIAWRMAVDLALSIRKDTRLSVWAQQMADAALSMAAADAFNDENLGDEPITPTLAARGDIG